jgi:hypothetical protein
LKRFFFGKIILDEYPSDFSLIVFKVKGCDLVQVAADFLAAHWWWLVGRFAFFAEWTDALDSCRFPE